MPSSLHTLRSYGEVHSISSKANSQCHVLHTSDTVTITHLCILRSLEIRLVGRFSLWGDRDWFDKAVAAGRFRCTVHFLEVTRIFALCDTHLYRGSCFRPARAIWYRYHSAGTPHRRSICTVPRLERLLRQPHKKFQKFPLPSVRTTVFPLYHGMYTPKFAHYAHYDADYAHYAHYTQ